ncbi:hypothetical protein H0X06_01325 [Candidatus Dependentiae bacterium]|nr:hypothetical protein [Candidatus Dependentiae bacterium]
MATIWCILLIPVSIYARSEENKKDETLISAIESGTVKLVEKLLIGEGIVDEKYKNLLLDIAHGRVEHYENVISEVSRVHDLRKFLWGARVGTVASIAGTVVALISHKDTEQHVVPFSEDRVRIGALSTTLVAMICTTYCISSLLNDVVVSAVNQKVLRSSRVMLKDAREIEDLIRNAPVSTKDNDLK